MPRARLARRNMSSRPVHRDRPDNRRPPTFRTLPLPLFQSTKESPHKMFGVWMTLPGKLSPTQRIGRSLLQLQRSGTA